MPDMGQITQVSSMAAWHIWFWRPLIYGALFWTRLVSFGSETVQFFAGIVHFEPFSNESWSVNHQPNMVIHTKNAVVSQKKTVVLLMNNAKNHLHLAGIL